VDAHQKLVLAERKRTWRRAWALNAFIGGYLLLTAWFLVGNLVVPFPKTVELPAWLVGSLLFVAGVHAFAWTRSNTSTGRLLLEAAHPILKGQAAQPGFVWLRSYSGILTLLVVVLTIWLGAHLTHFSFRTLFSQSGLLGAQRIFFALASPEFSILPTVLLAMLETIFIALMATLIAIPVAFVASFLCARNLMKTGPVAMTVYNVLRFIFNFSRSMEPLIWAIIFSVWVGIGPFAGMLALMIHSVASLAKLYSEQIENIDRGPLEAVETTGANRIQTVWYAVVPQIILPYLSYTIYRWDINIRMATIIGLVGGGGVGTLLMQYQGLARWNEVGMIVIVIAAVVWAMDYVSARIREAIY
jgi:phosphonate transport system permease protein